MTNTRSSARLGLVGTHRPQIALKVPHIELRAALRKGRGARHMQFAHDVGTGRNSLVEMASDRFSVGCDQRDRGHTNLELTQAAAAIEGGPPLR